MTWPARGATKRPILWASGPVLGAVGGGVRPGGRRARRRVARGQACALLGGPPGAGQPGDDVGQPLGRAWLLHGGVRPLPADLARRPSRPAHLPVPGRVWRPGAFDHRMTCPSVASGPGAASLCVEAEGRRRGKPPLRLVPVRPLRSGAGHRQVGRWGGVGSAPKRRARSGRVRPARPGDR